MMIMIHDQFLQQLCAVIGPEFSVEQLQQYWDLIEPSIIDPEHRLSRGVSFQMRYPTLFPQNHLIPMKWGWFDIVDNLSCALADINGILPEKLQIQVYDIKEKFGALRYDWWVEEENIPPHYEKLIDVARELTNYAANLSLHICDVCGQPGSRRMDLNWISTLCDQHYELRLKAPTGC